MAGTATGTDRAVVLVHGLWLGGWSLVPLARRLARCGFTAYRYSFPTCRLDLRENAARLRDFARGIPAPEMHFVGHSLGGIVIRAMFHYFDFDRPGRVVTLGSPHRGSAAAAQFGRSSVGRRCLGRSVGAMLAGEPRAYRPLEREVGVIAGSVPLGLGRLFVRHEEVNDGVITVTEAGLPEATETITVATSHSGMLLSREVAAQVCAFLRDGHFARGGLIEPARGVRKGRAGC